jgi:hypothetical protein
MSIAGKTAPAPDDSNASGNQRAGVVLVARDVFRSRRQATWLDVQRMLKSRPGGTLIELLVALLLLDLALLSLTTVGAVTARRVGDAGRRSRAAIAAANRLERLAALPCTAMAGGSAALERGVTETWTATRQGSSMELSDSIEIAIRAPERIVVRRRAPCA